MEPQSHPSRPEPHQETLEPQAISNLQMPLHRRMDRTRNLPNSGRQCRPSLHGQTTRRENIPGSRGNTSGAGVKMARPKGVEPLTF